MSTRWKMFNKGLMYQYTVTGLDSNKDETYVGFTNNTFKTKVNGHTTQAVLEMKTKEMPAHQVNIFGN